ncbi:hypothetical protein [uncultured Winogradskyella sp.]|uniref:hypothetical protein n=1 Tax=uncultured Winogradskyella sp. TaxID=395353 RepID=UPI00260458EE|nr:hypothetical protein [uncultured Winogradskyella sp.]
MNSSRIIKLKLKRVDPVKYAIVATLTYLAILLLIFVPVMLIASAVGMTQDAVGGFAIMGGGIFVIIFAMIFYGAIIFVVTLLASMLLNFILKKTGGIPIEFEGHDLELQNNIDFTSSSQERLKQ